MNLPAMPSYEKIETVVFSYMSHGTEKGAFGECRRFAEGKLAVLVDHKLYCVRNTAHGWEVSRKGMAAIDSSLLEAARNLINS